MIYCVEDEKNIRELLVYIPLKLPDLQQRDWQMEKSFAQP